MYRRGFHPCTPGAPLRGIALLYIHRDAFSMANFAPRSSDISRTTSETRVDLSLDLDEDASYETDTGIAFLDHMLDLFARHGRFGLHVSCDGDIDVDDHHTTEDIGIVLGQAFREALGDKEHIARYGHAYVPMDETLARAVVDLSGRFSFAGDLPFTRAQVGDLSTEMISHFWKSFAEHAGCNLHIDLIRGTNAHHQAEAIFKAVAVALRKAVSRHEQQARMPSTKGTL